MKVGKEVNEKMRGVASGKNVGKRESVKLDSVRARESEREGVRLRKKVGGMFIQG